MHPPIYVFFIQISLLASLTAYFQRNTDFYLRLFPLFLLITGGVEILADYMAMHDIPNAMLYNFFFIFEFCFYFFALIRIVSNKKAKKGIFLLILVFLLLAAWNLLFNQKRAFNTMTYDLGCLLIVAICIYYFFELFLLPYSVNLLGQPAFWICSGLLFFYACSFTIIGSINFLNKMPRVIIGNLVSIVYLLNVFLYSSFTIAFLCRLKTRKSSS